MEARQRTPAQCDGANGARGLIIGDQDPTRIATGWA
jgi:hypothetical protein